METDETLAGYASKGDEAAFETLMRKYESTVFNLAFHALRSREDALDVSQEIFLKVYKSLGKFRGDAKFSTWLYRISENAIRDHVRKSKRRLPTVPLDLTAEDDSPPPDLPDEDVRSDPQNALTEKLDREILREAIAGLPENYRSVLILRDMEDYSYQEISEMTDTDLGTVKSRIFRAREALKKTLEERNFFG